MNITMSYLLSQIFIIVNYLLLMVTYQQNNREKVLITNLLAQLVTCASYLCLSAYTGVAMGLFSIARNIIFYIDEKNNGKSEDINGRDVLILLVLIAVIILLTYFTYDGILSLMAVFATTLYTYSVWQKNTRVYKLLGIPVSIMGILYNIFVFSLSGIVLESIVLVSALVGLVKERIRVWIIKN